MAIPADMTEDGLLWAINKVLFHPRGFALAYDPDIRGFQLLGDGSEAWQFEADTDDAKFKQFEAFLQRAKEHNAGVQ
jgi:hypothetical protein